MKRLRVGVDFHEWDGIFQGSRNHVLGIYRHAINQAPDIDFFFFLESTESLREAHEEFRRSNVQLVRMPRRNGLIRLGLQLPWLRFRLGIDVLHAQYRLPFIKTGRSVCTIHDILFETHPEFFPSGFVKEARLTYRLAVRQADLIFTVSEFSKQEITRIYQVPLTKVQVTYNGVDRAKFFPGDEGRERVQGLGLVPGQYILIVGRLEPRKNHLALINAWAQLGASAPPLVIVGQEDPNFPDVREAIDAMADTHKVIRFKQMGDDVLPDVMRHAAVFVYPAFAEGFGMPVAEAMACGVPVITSNSTSLREVAADGAVLFEPGDQQGLYMALKATLAMPVLARQALIACALKRVAHFDWNQSAAVLLAGLRGVSSAVTSERVVHAKPHKID